MKQLTGWLVVFGFLAWVVFPFLAWFTPLAGNDFVSAHQKPSLLTSIASFAYGAVCFWLAWGIHRHLPTAWRIGFVALVALWLQMVFEVFITLTEPGHGVAPSFAIIALIVLVMSLVFLYWGWRWYAQRSYFTEAHKG